MNTFKLKLGLRSATVLMMLGSLSLGACVLAPTRPALTSSGPERGTGPALVVQADDPIVGEVICESLAQTAYFRSVRCVGGDRERVAALRWVSRPATNAPPNLPRGPEADSATYVLNVNSRVYDSSTDYKRNAAYSLATLTTLAMISTSAVTRFDMSLGPAGRAPRRLIVSGRGRVGMWAVIPLFTGFVGTTFGTALNGYRLPTRLRRRCLARESDAEACADYRLYMRDAFGRVAESTFQAIRDDIALRGGEDV